MKIYKYPLKLTASQTVFLPYCAEILSVQMQGGLLTLWAEVSSEAYGDPVQRQILICPTGESEGDIDQCRHISTVLDGTLVWHVFEVIA